MEEHISWRARRAWLGAGLGLVLGVVDSLCFVGLGVELMLDERDMTWPVFGVFTFNLVALGYIAGWLLESRHQLRQAAAALAASQAHALEQERLALHHAHLAEIGQMAAGVAHEVRNPLAVIKSATTIVVQELADGSDARQAADFVLEEVDLLDGFVRDLLLYARPLQLHVRPIEASELVVALNERLARGGVPAVMDAEIAGTWEIDVDLVGQIVAGLVDNARHFAQRVEVQVAQRDDALEIAVCDDGPGIEPERRQSIFEPFVTSREGGTGLGLAMARRISDALGGRIAYLDHRGLGDRQHGACLAITFERSTR